MAAIKREHFGKSRFKKQDIVEIALGACIMGFPVAVTEEVWNLGTELTLTHSLLFTFASLFVLAVLIYVLHEHDDTRDSRKAFVHRVLATYCATLLIAALLLYGVNRLGLFENPAVALKRTILVAFPASFAATVVDSFSPSTS